MRNRNIIVKLMMFISSYFPLFIMVLILWHKKIVKNAHQGQVLWIFFLIIIILMILISFLSFVLLIKGSYSKIINVKHISRPDDTVLSYIMTYVIPLISGDEVSTELFIVNFLLFILIGYIYIRLNLIYLNPLWAIFGYVIYRMGDGIIIITNIPFVRINKLDNLRGYYLSNGIFVAHSKYNSNLYNP